MIELLQELLDKEEIRLKQLRQGLAVGEMMTKEDMRRDVVISRAQKCLEWGGFVDITI